MALLTYLENNDIQIPTLLSTSAKIISLDYDNKGTLLETKHLVVRNPLES